MELTPASKENFELARSFVRMNEIASGSIGPGTVFGNDNERSRKTKTGGWCLYRLVMTCRRRNVREGRFLCNCTLRGNAWG
jgi:hypothetical protein